MSRARVIWRCSARALVRDFPGPPIVFYAEGTGFKGLTYYNANRLLWRDITVDGLKAGRTPQAGYCLSASAKRGDQRRIAIVLGARSDTLRTQDALKLLNYGFENFDSVLLYRAQQPVKVANVYRGDACVARSRVPAGLSSDDSARQRRAHQGAGHHPTAHVAPVSKGQRMGSCA